MCSILACIRAALLTVCGYVFAVVCLMAYLPFCSRSFSFVVLFALSMLPESLVASALFSQCVSYCFCHRCFLCSHDFCHLCFHYDAYLRFTAFAFLISCSIVLVFLSVGVVNFIALASLLLAHWLHYPLCRCHRYWHCYHRCSSWYRCGFSSLLCLAETHHATCLRAAHRRHRM